MSLIDSGWRMACTPAGAWSEPPGAEDPEWLTAVVPGTVAGALARSGRPEPIGESRIDDRDWWFATSFDADPAAGDEEVVLGFGGIATVWEVHLNGQVVCEGTSMFEQREVDVGQLLRGHNGLAICCRALAPLLEESRRPRARWRTRVAGRNLRFFRTSLFGRAPGFAPGPPPIGPFRPVTLQRRTGILLRQVRLLPRLDGDTGILTIEARLTVAPDRADDAMAVRLEGPSGDHHADLDVERDGGDVVARGELAVPDVARWWPHTHGPQPLHAVRLVAGACELDVGKVGFRRLAAGPHAGHDVGSEGLHLHVNETPVFVRGALWTTIDPLDLAPSGAELRAALEQVRDAGMNMLRVPGTGVYESAEFHDLCDELGLLVWQDFMFANFDYPLEAPGFLDAVVQEARQVLSGLAGRASLAVLCGNSEIEQQVAMLGLEPALGRGSLFEEILPRMVGESGADAVYIPSAPCGGDLPFRPGSGISNYFGVGGYRRPLSDARLADVRFASECLAFANLPDGQPADKMGVPRDVGSPWDFEDVRDHYLHLLHGVDPAQLRSDDPDCYAELSRSVSGEVMAEVMGEWRRSASACGGALVLCLNDVLPGAGWGLIDASGTPKVAYHHLRRVLAPLATWTTDEGLGGIAVHVANDGPERFAGRLRVSLYAEFEQLVDEAELDLALDPHGWWTGDVEGVLGHFRDVTWAYRFGPPAQNAVVVSLLSDVAGPPVSQAVRFPIGPPAQRETLDELGLEATLRRSADGGLELALRSRRLIYGVRPQVPGYTPDDDAFFVEPGRERVVGLRQAGPPLPGAGTVTALNLDGVASIDAEGPTT